MGRVLSDRLESIVRVDERKIPTILDRNTGGSCGRTGDIINNSPLYIFFKKKLLVFNNLITLQKVTSFKTVFALQKGATFLRTYFLYKKVLLLKTVFALQYQRRHACNNRIIIICIPYITFLFLLQL